MLYYADLLELLDMGLPKYSEGCTSSRLLRTSSIYTRGIDLLGRAPSCKIEAAVSEICSNLDHLSA